MFGSIAELGGTFEKTAFVSPVSDFYFTNPIARASRVMAECSALARGVQREADTGDEDPGSAPPGPPSGPVPAMINLIVQSGTLFGWDTMPSEAGGWGLAFVVPGSKRSNNR